MISETQRTIEARDGTPLAATVTAPTIDTGGPSVLLNSAMAVPRKIYAPFARFLAARGATVVTYDYRGIGESRPDRLRGYPARLRDWAERDAAGVCDWLVAERPGARLLGFGHSFGGQAYALMSDNDRFARITLLASQGGYWRLLGPRERWRVYALLGGVLPAAAFAFGYIPAKRYKFGEDIPAGVLAEWRRWCFMPNYFYDDPTLNAAASAVRVRAPVTAFGVSDDGLATAEGIGLLLSGFTGAAIERHTLTPAQAGTQKLGHFGFFRAENQKTLWPQVTDALLGAP